ncbi:DUF7282 domain-containing protein [Halorussus halobius]|uniref:DUF7282 domain-containing protein n=1 Tax=Halorussus halobius TaxID=1710537 RepID=UPI0010931E86|nr:hypothetical protein [Halorussus halobius]
MTRDSKTISAVFMTVVLVLASGAAVSFAATADDGGANAIGVQDTTTGDGLNETTTEDDGVDEGDGVGETETEEDGETAEGASITIDEQESDGEMLVVDSVTVPEGGFVVIHEENWEGAPLSTVLGSSVYLDAGTHEDVELSLARPLEESQTVVAMLHSDTNDNRVLDFVLSSGNLDGPIVEDESPVVDDAEVTVGQDTTTEEDVETVTTTEEDDVETVTTTTEEDMETVTTTEEDDVETVTTTEEDEVETVTTTEEEGMQQLVFKVEEMAIDRWSFVVGDEEMPDETVYVNGSELFPPDGSLTDERVTVDLAELAEQGEVEQEDLMATTTRSPEEIEQDIEENLSGDIPTVRYVVQGVNVENATLVVTVPEDMDLPEQPTVEEPTTTEEDVETVTTTEEEDVETVTTTEEDVETMTTTEADVVDETTTEEDVETMTTTEEEVDETTTEEDVETMTTTEADVVDETTTEEEDVETVTTTEEDVVETTTEEAEVTETTTVDEPAGEASSFEVAELDAPASVAVGDTIDVSATVSNPNDEEATQTVAFRLQGDVVAREDVTLGAGEETTVSFGVDTTGIEPGEYVHGVYTVEFGELDVIVLEDAADDESDEGDTASDEETTVGDEMETTTTAAE